MPNNSSLPPSYLEEVARCYPTPEAAFNQIALLSAYLELPRPTVHIVSDVHGEHKKLRHVINNGSGSLRLLVQQLLGSSLDGPEQLRLLSFIYYPHESYLFHLGESPTPEARSELLMKLIPSQLEIIRELAKRYPLEEVAKKLPRPYLQLFRELILSPLFGRSSQQLPLLMNQVLKYNKDLELIRLTSRAIRNLNIAELIVAGDLGDRGPRIDKVIGFLAHQPNVSIVWGNHDTTWMAACLGHRLSIASVVRISLRYGNIAQLEEGYGIPLDELEALADAVYSTDPVERFRIKGKNARDPLLLARMQKAIAIIEFKLQGQAVARNPQYDLESRNLLHRISADRKSVEIDGKSYPMLDSFLPTLDAASPYQLTAGEEDCIKKLQELFLGSNTLWRQMSYVAQNGSMYLSRDTTLIFHACVPVDKDGNFLALSIDGQLHKGRALFDTIEACVQRAFDEKRSSDLDLLWYLWCGPLSPLFGKDKIATFENYFVEDEAIRHESKNPYFSLIHEKEFCQSILAEFGITAADGLIVNGHVPVKIEKGESPLKRSGMAVTIDGAFSEAYGDHGYTLILKPTGSSLAQHHHFESVEDSIKNGTDMIPEMRTISSYETERRVSHTELGAVIREKIALIEQLLESYRLNRLRPQNDRTF